MRSKLLSSITFLMYGSIDLGELQSGSFTSLSRPWIRQLSAHCWPKKNSPYIALHWPQLLINDYHVNKKKSLVILISTHIMQSLIRSGPESKQWLRSTLSKTMTTSDKIALIFINSEILHKKLQEFNRKNQKKDYFYYSNTLLKMIEK